MPESRLEPATLSAHKILGPAGDRRVRRTPLGLSAVRLDNSQAAREYSGKERACAEGKLLRLVLEHRHVYVAQAFDDEAMIAGDERFRAIVQHAALGIGLVSLEGVILHANPRFSEFLGIPAEQLAGMSLADFTHPDDVIADLTKFYELIRGEREEYQMEKRYLRADGQTVWGRLSTSLARRGDGSVEYVIGVVEDITENRQLKHAIGERVKELNAMRALSKRLLRASRGTVQELLQDVADLMPPAFQFPEITAARVRLGGLEAVSGPFHDEHATLTTAWCAPNDNAGSIEVQYTSASPDSDEGPFLAEERALIDSVAELLRVATLGLREAAERESAEQALRSSEDRLQFSLEAARMGTIEWDLINEQVHISDVTRQIFDFAEGTTTVTVAGFRTHIHPDYRDLVQRAFRADLAGAPSKELEYRLQRPDGSNCWVVVRARVFFDEEGTPVRRIGVIVDVTSRHLLQEQFRHAQKMEAVGRLAGGVAHDFNNLLTVISAAADFVHFETEPGSQMQKDTQDIMDAVKRAHALTTQLLTFSRRQVVRPRNIDLNELVRGTDSMLRRLIGADVTLSLSIADEPVRVVADVGQIEQVVMNLVVNARDAITGPGLVSIGTGHVVVDADIAKLRPELEPGEYAVITVTDTGVGMDDATLERIFEPFFTTKEAGKGTGLGLATVFGIVKQAGGHVFVYSEPGLGTTFRVCLPYNDSSAVTKERQRSGSVPSVGGSETILLVEDEPHVRLLARRILAESGYSVLEAGSGHEALIAATLHDGPIHLLISDVVLPGMNGPDIADQLHQARPSMKVLYMSGYTPDALLHHRITEAGTPFIEKPFTRIGIAAAVRAALD